MPEIVLFRSMTFMYLVFGEDRSNYQQAIFSILSILPQLIDNEEIVVLTDSSYRLKLLNEKIRIIEINKETLETWKGNYHNVLRVKIMALLHIAKNTKNSSIIYFDADTFLYGSLQNLRGNLDNGHNVMHANEGKLSASKSKSQKPLWKSLKGKTLENIPINEEVCMWNSGVVGISKTRLQSLNTALNLCDTMIKAGVEPRLIEQLSISIALAHKGGIKSADTDIGHYWGNKPMWNKKIEDFLLNSLFCNLTIEAMMQKIKNMNFEEIPINIKSKDTKIRLQELISKTFKDKKVEFIKKT